MSVSRASTKSSKVAGMAFMVREFHIDDNEEETILPHYPDEAVPLVDKCTVGPGNGKWLWTPFPCLRALPWLLKEVNPSL